MSTTPSAGAGFDGQSKQSSSPCQLLGLVYLAIEKGMFKSEPRIFPKRCNIRQKRNPAEKDTKETTTKKLPAVSCVLLIILPEKPVDGELKGIVKVGATGFNSFVINYG
jgi:hypothetical protein